MNVLEAFDTPIFIDEIDKFILICDSQNWQCCVKDRNSVYIDGNQLAAEMDGYKHRGELPGITDAELKCPAAESCEQYVYQDQLAMEAGVSQNILDVHPYADGNTHCLQSLKIPVINQQSDVVGIFWLGAPIQSSSNLLNYLGRISPCNQPFSFKENYSYLIKPAFEQYGLTPFESEIVFHLLRGQSIADISHHYHSYELSEQFAIIAHKMGCHTIEQVIEKAIVDQLQLTIPEHMLTQQNFGLLLPSK